ncbi:hypothetical protein ABZ744_25305 [Micromonospora chersina]|uniref:hypothetical protein n=1 Tax=Micromonospora chersina TaxID=47854 RepID=UPI0033D692C1
MDEPGTAGRTLRLHPAAAVNPSAPAAPLADAATRRVRPGLPADLPEPGAARTATPRAGDLRVHLLSSGRQQVHPNLSAPAHGTANGTAGQPASDRPGWIGAAAGPWPMLPAEAREQTGDRAAGSARHEANGSPRRDPWPALPDDRGLWAPVVAPGDTDRLARLDREQAGD